FTRTENTADVIQAETDGPWAAYEVLRGDLLSDLFSVRLDRIEPAIPLALGVILSGATSTDPTRWKLSASAGRVLLRSQNTLFSVPLDGSAPLAQIAQFVGQYAFDPSGQSVVYVGAGLLTRTPLDGSSAPVPLSTPSTPGHYKTVEAFAFGADGA